MGYYTNYSLEVIGDDYSADHEVEISKASDYSNCFGESIKWYGHDEDMREYSKKFPEMIFKLSGEGEDSGDLWVTYYKNGKAQSSKVKIQYDEFDESKLQ